MQTRPIRFLAPVLIVAALGVTGGVVRRAAATGPPRTAADSSLHPFPGVRAAPALGTARDRLAGGVAPASLATVRDYLRRAEAAGFSGAVAVGQGGEVLLDEGYGEATCYDRAVTTDTPFYVASLSKAVTAAAILKLEAAGRLRTSDPIGRHLPDVPDDKRVITIHDLLTHASGLSRLPRDVRAVAVARDAFVRAALAQPLRDEPGARHRYSNLGYSLLAAIVERASGRPFAEYLRAAIFGPAGMDDTGLVTEPEHWPAGRLAHACNGTLDQGDAVLRHHRPLGWTELGAIGVVSTASDMLRWTRALRSGRLLPPDAVERMFTAHADDYGYGWVVTTRDSGERMGWHTGLLLPEGWNSQIRIYPDRDLALVVLSNRYDQEALGWSVARTVDRVLLGGELTLPPPVEPTGHAVGAGGVADVERTYGLSEGGFTIVRRGERLLLEPRGQTAVNVVLGVAAERAPSLAKANARTREFLDRVFAAGPASVSDSLSGRPADEWLPRFEETWRWLEERFGVRRGYEVLQSVPAPFGDDAALTFVRLDFAHGSTTVRVIWADGAFRGMSDRGAFVGATPAVAVVPAPVPLSPTGDDTYSGFRLATGEAVHVRIAVGGGGGCRELRVYGPGDSVTARTTDGCASP